jgi:hypothetical protein
VPCGAVFASAATGNRATWRDFSEALSVRQTRVSSATTSAALDALAPQLKDLRGIEVLLSVGADDRDTALNQAEAVKAALVERGADASGLRPVPAPKNNAFALKVRERE